MNESSTGVVCAYTYVGVRVCVCVCVTDHKSNRLVVCVFRHASQVLAYTRLTLRRLQSICPAGYPIWLNFSAVGNGIAGNSKSKATPC